MNLASRCREAISHVAMLKKELAMHQRRSAEALVAQRQSLQRRPSSDIDTLATSAEVAVEMDRMDRIIAAAQAPPQLTPVPMAPVTAKAKSNVTKPINTVTKNSFGDESRRGGSVPFRSEEEDDEEQYEVSGEELMVTTMSRVIFPHSPSPKISDDMYNESFPEDLPPQRLLGAHFRRSPALLETDHDDRSYTSSMSDDRSALSTQSGVNRGGIVSSMDAFEASFNTSFPANFSSSKDENLVAVNAAQPAIYNPFAPSPTKNQKIGDEAEVSRFGIRDRSPMRRKVESSTTPKPATPAPYRKATLSTVPASPKPGDEQDEKPPVNQRTSVRTSSPSSLPTMPRSGGSSRNNILPMNEKRLSSPSPASRLFPRSSPRASPPQVPDPDSPEFTYSPDKQDSTEAQNYVTEQPFSSPTKFSTPTENLSPEVSPDPEQPRRPEKTASASARARYEKALQPRAFTGPSTTRNIGRLGAKTRFLNSDSEDEDPSGRTDGELEVQPPLAPTEPSPSEKVSGLKSPSLVLKRLQQRRVKERMANDERMSNTSDTGSVISTSTYTSALSTNVDHLSTISGSTNSRAESRRRLVALRVVAKSNSDIPAGSPFDEGDGPARSASARDFGSFRNPDGGDEIMGQSDPASYVGSLSTRNLKTYGGTTDFESPVLSTRNATSESPVLSGRFVYGSPAASDSPVLSGKYSYGSTTGAEYSNNLSPDSMMKESNALDAMAATVSQPTIISPPPNADAATSRFATTGKLRRSVKQPISYAEPTLNSKLRRGDIYFEKGHENSLGFAPPQGAD
jgi:Shugoshin C terminus